MKQLNKRPNSTLREPTKFVNSKHADSSTRPITQQQLEQYLWGAAILLRGVIDPGEYKGIIFPIMFFKRISDVYDEEFELALRQSGGDKDYAGYDENHRFKIPEGAHWNDVRTVTKEVGKAIKHAMRAIEKSNPGKLEGIFGDTNWTNKDRLSDRILMDLLEHFSTITLSIKNVPQDEFGNAYEFLIKKFADDSGHTAAEFYTGRTVARLMTFIVDPRPGESIYDPTAGSGGLLLSAILLVRDKRQEWRNMSVYGQEINLITSAIARMNCFIHGIEDFHIARGDTLAQPAFHEGDKVQKFDICLANPPYSIKKWNREGWAHDPWGRNIYGIPPQGCADYAFLQHIICSLKTKNGRCAILYPHGILFRDSELHMRQKLIEADVVDAVIGLGPNLFYNSTMESCILVCRINKPKKRKGKILFINGVDEAVQNKTQAHLSEQNIKTLHKLYEKFKNVSGKSYVATIAEVKSKGYKLSIPLYLERYQVKKVEDDIADLVAKWQESSKNLAKDHKAFAETTKEALGRG